MEKREKREKIFLNWLNGVGLFFIFLIIIAYVKNKRFYEILYEEWGTREGEIAKLCFLGACISSYFFIRALIEPELIKKGNFTRCGLASFFVLNAVYSFFHFVYDYRITTIDFYLFLPFLLTLLMILLYGSISLWVE